MSGRTRPFTLLEITSGLPDDSREADEREEARRLRDLRGRVKAARAMVAITPGLAETLAHDSRKAALFYAQFRISERILRLGVAQSDKSGEHLVDRVQPLFPDFRNPRARKFAQVPTQNAVSSADFYASRK